MLKNLEKVDPLARQDTMIKSALLVFVDFRRQDGRDHWKFDTKCPHYFGKTFR